MRYKIHYCVVWNYYPRAASLADSIKSEFPDAEVQFMKGSSGIFDVFMDETLIFSKFSAGRFPETEEILESIRNSQQI